MRRSALLLLAACAGEVGGLDEVPIAQPSVEVTPSRTDRAAGFPMPAMVTPQPGQQAVIIAQGMMGRTMLSCDDGQTWVHDRAFDTEASDMVCGDSTPVRCEQTSCKLKQPNGTCTTASPCDCGHHPGYAKGVAIANGQILASFGWGHPGIVLRSSNGAQWAESRRFDGSYLFPNVAFGAGRFVHFSSEPMVSEDGVAWREGGFAGFNGQGMGWTSPRAFAFLDYGTGRFIGGIDGNTIRVSSDGAETWRAAASVPAGCTDGIGSSQQMLTGNGVAVIVTSNGFACRSGDGGDTWTLHRIAASVSPWGVFANGHFTAWGGGTRYTSTDGMSWTATAMTGSVGLGAVGASVSGTLVAVNSVWVGYEQQRLLRSTDDGLTWVTLPDGAYAKGHAIHRFAAGLVYGSSACPR